MEHVLIISSSENGIPFIVEMLEQIEIVDVDIVSNIEEAKRQIELVVYDLCIVNAPLTDEFGDQFAKDFVKKNSGEAMVLVKAELYDKAYGKLDPAGVVVVSKPVSKTVLTNALKVTQATHNRIKHFQNENEKLQRELQDMKIINRAKCLLISCLRMTELEAHKHIERQAMDMRMTKRSVAEGILKTYDN